MLWKPEVMWMASIRQFNGIINNNKPQKIFWLASQLFKSAICKFIQCTYVNTLTVYMTLETNKLSP